ncbi:hypothetical protein [Pseudoalteromonas umbrosa]|nr:hypothetical protein [Pseudoalteromonas sp. B95]MDK1287542.1 hypothetical protein [Pseudoalteromonas sp. B95]
MAKTPSEQFWMNADCGLETRGLEEARAAL